MGENKRKQPPQGGSQPQAKKSKRGNEGKWQTPHQRVNIERRLEFGATIEAGDTGIWVTCQRGLEKKAMAEMTRVCEELGQAMYGIKPPSEDAEKAALELAKGDISDAVAAELEELKAEPKKSKADYAFLPVRTDIECVFFMKTRPPVEPAAFVNRICDEVVRFCGDAAERKLRHVNRLTPVVTIGKALDRGVEKVGREVLGGCLELRKEDGDGDEVEERSEIPAHTYAIRPTIRASSSKRDEVINRVAALVSPKHKVNLGNPDKVILIEIYKNHCGMCVVDGPRWEGMKKFNMNELYKIAGKRNDGKDTGNGTKDKEETNPKDAKGESNNKENEPKDGYGSGTAEKADKDGLKPSE